MAALHEALQILSPTDFSSVPLSDLTSYLQDVFSKSQLLVDSVPISPVDSSSTPTARSRSNTATLSTASDVSEILASTARPEAPEPTMAAWQKEWGKPIKLAAKDNPLGMSVYKCGGKDGKGAWFARRSVHEGLGFKRWQKSLEREFPETMEVQGGPGEGNIRGIGGERRVEQTVAEGVGKLEVYHLSAQFPGPTTPRDFVTLLLTSSNAPNYSSSATANSAQSELTSAPLTSHPRHYMVVSRPCNHPECPPRDGFIRGQYESVEFIREIPIQRSTSSSSLDLEVFQSAPKLGKEAAIRSATKSRTFPVHEDGSKLLGDKVKGETIENRHPEDGGAELNPVEWIMITRSDPGGSVPRWMVERGTPQGIVADASKFLDWACKKEHLESDVEDEEEKPHSLVHQDREEDKLRGYQTNGHLAGIDSEEKTEDQAVDDAASSSTDAATSSDESFVSADDYLGDSKSTKSTSSSKNKANISPYEKELARLNQRIAKVSQQLAKTREKGVKDQAQLKKAEEKHTKEVAKHQERYTRNVARLEAKKDKQAKRAEEKQRKAEDRDEKTRLQKERDEMSSQIDNLTKERDNLKSQVGDLQKENTALVARLGRSGADRNELMGKIKDEAGTSGGKSPGRTSRSPSLKSR